MMVKWINVLATLLIVLTISEVTYAAMVSASAFSCMFPRVPLSKINQYIPDLNNMFLNFSIDNYQRVTMFMAQTGVETDGYSTFKEYTDRNGTNPNCRRYDGGCRYIGRGAMQLTNRFNYFSAGFILGQDFVDQPEIVADLPWAFRTAGWFWQANALNGPADEGDINTVTRRITGAFSGLNARIALYATAKLCIPEFPGNGTTPKPFPVPPRTPNAPLPPSVATPSGCVPTNYVVAQGDTLSSIALRFNVSVSRIMEANNITNPNLIFVGEILIIPCQ